MASSATNKCPSCGAYLEYQPGQSVMRCPYCGSDFRIADIQQEKDTAAQPVPQTDVDETAATTVPGDGYMEYHCQNCGAEVVTGPTTAATRCYFCHSPVTLTDRLSGEFKPNQVVPFALDKQGAEQAFQKWIRSKHFVDRRFLSEDQLTMFSGVYYPYWLGSVRGTTTFDGTGTKVDTSVSGSRMTTITSYYNVHREAENHFTGLVRKALQRVDKRMADGIQPYRMNEAKGYNPGYLSGFMAEMRDMDQETARSDMLENCRSRAENMIREKRGLNTLKGTAHFTPGQVYMHYALMPAWILTYKSEREKPYYFMMNGQTGKIFGRLPIKQSKLLAVSAILGGIVAALLCVGGAMLW